MTDNLPRKLSLVSHGTRYQFSIGIALVSVLPLLTLFCMEHLDLFPEAMEPQYCRPLALGFGLAIALSGYVILRKYPLNIQRLRRYSEAIVKGELPEHIALLDTESDIKVIEDSMNAIIKELKGREAGLKLEKEELLKQLYEAQKIESIGTLSGQIAHQFNNLIMAIMGYSELIMRNPNADKTIHSDATEIKEAGRQAALLTRQLLAFARRQPLKQEVQQLNAVITGSLEIIRTILGEDIELIVNLAVDLQPVYVDANQIAQVIINLMTNARDAMPNGGKLVLQTEQVVLDEHLMKITPESTPGHYARVIIQDTGTGIDKDVLPRIFEPFFTTRKERSTGLGLSVAHGIVKQHGGWINVYSEPEHGSIFKIYLPTIPTSSEAGQSGANDAANILSTRGKGERILLVEDDQHVREFTLRSLTENGYVVVAVQDGDAAVDIFEGANQPFDLLFSDVVLPGARNGIELADLLLKRKPGLKILLASGYTEPKLQWPLIRERGYRFMHKPCAISDMLAILRSVLESKQVESSAQHAAQ
jgi:two-component system, cell cycle sensor histidine kinase and response regulator CckA